MADDALSTILGAIARMSYSPTNYLNKYDNDPASPTYQKFIDPKTGQPAAIQAPYKPLSGYQNAFNAPAAAQVQEANAPFIGATASGDLATRLLERKASQLHDYSSQNPTFGEEYLAGTGGLRPESMALSNENIARRVAGTYPAQAGAETTTANATTKITPSEIARHIAENVAGTTQAGNQNVLAGLQGGVYGNPAFQSSFQNEGVTQQQALAQQSGGNLAKAQLERGLAEEAAANEPEAAEIQRASRGSQMFESRYHPLAFGNILDTETGEIKYMPMLGTTQSAMLAQSLGRGGATQSVVGPNGKTLTIPRAQSIPLFSRPALGYNPLTQEEEINDENQKPTVTRPSTQSQRRVEGLIPGEVHAANLGNAPSNIGTVIGNAADVARRGMANLGVSLFGGHKEAAPNEPTTVLDVIKRKQQLGLPITDKDIQEAKQYLQENYSPEEIRKASQAR